MGAALTLSLAGCDGGTTGSADPDGGLADAQADAAPEDAGAQGDAGRPDAGDGGTDAGADGGDAGQAQTYGVCTQDAWCMELPSPTSAALYGVLAGPEQTTLMLGERGVGVSFDGEGFVSIETGVDSDLFAAAQLSTGDAFVVGADSTVLRFHEGEFQPLRLNPGADAGAEPVDDLFGVWAGAADDVWIVGDTATLWHFDGDTFTRASVSHALALRAVWGSDSDDVFAVGDGGRVDHYDGETWAPVSASTAGRSMRAVTGSGANDVWIAGDEGVVVHFDGETWSRVEGPGDVDIQAMHLEEDATLWVAGAEGQLFRRDPEAASWEMLSSGVQGTLHTLTLLSDGLWAVGEGGSVVRWQDDSRTVFSMGDRLNRQDIFQAGDSLWVVGDETLRGTPFESVAAGTERVLFGGFALGEDLAWAVGTSGTIVRWDGEQWTEQESGTSRQLRAVWAVDDATAWVAGERGTMLGLFNRSQWVAAQVPASALIHDLWGTTFDDVWAVGASGTVWHYDGTAWRALSLDEVDADLHSVHGTGPDDVWAVGALGTILHWNGLSWSIEQDGESYALNGVFAAAEDEVYVVGTRGRVLRYDGEKWHDEQSGSLSALESVLVAEQTVYAVGSGGLVLSRAR